MTQYAVTDPRTGERVSDVPTDTDEQVLEAVAHVALATFTNLVTRAGDLPRDGSIEEARLSQAA